jgi:hypothetical protein
MPPGVEAVTRDPSFLDSVASERLCLYAPPYGVRSGCEYLLDPVEPPEFQPHLAHVAVGGTGVLVTVGVDVGCIRTSMAELTCP